MRKSRQSAAPGGAPEHPRDLVHHDCLTFATTGSNWAFEGRRGLINVDVRTKLSVIDSRLRLDAAIAGLGIAPISRQIAQSALASGALVSALPDFPVPEFWVKALIPQNRADLPALRRLMSILKEGFAGANREPSAENEQAAAVGETTGLNLAMIKVRR